MGNAHQTRLRDWHDHGADHCVYDSHLRRQWVRDSRLVVISSVVGEDSKRGNRVGLREVVVQ